MDRTQDAVMNVHFEPTFVTVVIPLYHISASASALPQWMKEASKWVQDSSTILGFSDGI
jgi:hypothetical protein